MSQPPGAPVSPSIEVLPPPDADRMRLRDRRLLLSVVTSSGAQLASMAVSVVSLPLSFHYLGKQEFGLWAAVSSLMVWGSLLDLGVSRGLVNALSEAYGRDDRDAARAYLSTAFLGLTALAGVLAVIGALLWAFVDWAGLLAVHNSASGLVRNCVGAAIITFLVGLPLGVVQHVYAAHQRLYVANAFLVAGTLSTLGALGLCILLDASLPVLILCVGLAGNASTIVGLIWATHRTLPWLRISVRSFSRSAAARLRLSALPLFLFQAGALLVNETQIVILSRRTDLGVVADYSVLMRLYLAIMTFIALSSAAFAPSFREAHERADMPWLRRGFRRLLMLRGSLAVGAGALLILLGNRLLRSWVGGDVQFSRWVWLVAAVLMAASVWVTAYSDLLIALDRIWVQVGLVLLNGAVSVAGTYALAPRWHVLGVLIASTATSALLLSWLMPVIARESLGHRSA